MCNAHNHPPNCNCGWGEGSNSSFAGHMTSNQFTSHCLSVYSQAESFTTPNANCPVCGESVFYHKSQNGGSVYFDELGPPWPKHPCTNNGSTYNSFSLFPSTMYKKKNYQWKRAGFTPLLIQYTSLIFSERIVKISAVVDEEFLVVYAPKLSNTIQKNHPYLVKKTSANSFTISTFQLNDTDLGFTEVNFKLFLSPKYALSQVESKKPKTKSVAPLKVVRMPDKTPKKHKKKETKQLPTISLPKKTRKRALLYKKPINVRKKFPWLAHGYHRFEISEITATKDSRIKLAEGISEGKSIKMYYLSLIAIRKNSIIFIKASPFAFHELYIFYHPKKRSHEITYKKYSCYEDFNELADAENRKESYRSKSSPE